MSAAARARIIPGHKIAAGMISPRDIESREAAQEVARILLKNKKKLLDKNSLDKNSLDKKTL